MRQLADKTQGHTSHVHVHRGNIKYMLLIVILTYTIGAFSTVHPPYSIHDIVIELSDFGSTHVFNMTTWTCCDAHEILFSVIFQNISIQK